jgi:CubicO group peptidase (beta-lactamase class C family)
LNAGILSDLVARIRKGEEYPDIHSLLIVRNGFLVVEEYFAGYGADDLHTIQSVTKSITSALIGIAIDRGKIRGVTEKVLGFFPEHRDAGNVDARKAALIIEHLLTMRTGTDFHESPYRGSPLQHMNDLGKGWIRFVLDSAMIREPGTAFQYDSGGVILLAGILRKTTGLQADAFADKHLLEPLGISRSRWHRAGDGVPHTGGGLHLRPRDMAKFGLLYLRRGRWEDRRILPERWVEASSKRHVAAVSPRGRTGYGYLWWILPLSRDGSGSGDLYAAMGHMGQYIFVVPQHEMVAVVTAGTSSYADQRKPIEFLYSHILEAARTRGKATDGAPREPAGSR